MKKLIPNIGNWTFIFLLTLFLLVLSCKDDQEPVVPNPDGKVDPDSIGQNLILGDNKVFYFGVV